MNLTLGPIHIILPVIRFVIVYMWLETCLEKSTNIPEEILLINCRPISLFCDLLAGYIKQTRHQLNSFTLVIAINAALEEGDGDASSSLNIQMKSFR